MAFYGYDPMAHAQLNLQTRATLGANAAKSASDMISNVGNIIQSAQKAGKEKEVKTAAYAQYKALAETPLGQKAGLNVGQIPPPDSALDAASYVAQLTQKVWPNWSAQLSKAGVTPEEIQQAIQQAPAMADTTGLVTRQGQLGMAEGLKTQFPTSDVLAQDAAAGGFNLNPQGPVQNAPEASVMVPPAGGQAGPPELVPTSSPVKFETPTDYMSALQPMIQRGLQRNTMSEKDASDIMAEALKLDTTLKIKELDAEKARLNALKQSAGEFSGKVISGGGKAFKRDTGEEVTKVDPMAVVQNEYDVTPGKLPSYSYSFGSGRSSQDPAVVLGNALLKRLAAPEDIVYSEDANGNMIPRAKPNTLAARVMQNPRLSAVYSWIFYPDLARQAHIERPSQSEIDLVMQDISQSDTSADQPASEGAVVTPGGFIIR